ncbi:MAG: glycosyltransferase family 2 protein [Planctomycetes bacterium]|nr:glycosyltransferase family 2 protein [Planctomycetota bacterium]
MAERDFKVLCIVPAYNEEEAVVGVIRDIREHVPHADVLVVDDGSVDRTAARARAAGAIVCNLSYNLGIGAAVQTGLKYAHTQGYDVAIQVDGDGQHPAEQIHKLLGLLRDRPEVDMVLGSRFLQDTGYESPATRKAGIQIFSVVLSAVCGQKLTDTTSGFRATRGEAIGFLARYYPRDYPEVEALVLLHQAGYVIREVPTQMRQRQGGESSIRLFHGVYYMIKVLLSLLIELLKKAKGRKGDPTSLARRSMD